MHLPHGFCMHTDGEGALVKGIDFLEFLADRKGRIHLGLPGRPNSRALAEGAAVRPISELIAGGLRDSCLDPRHWDSVGEYQCVLRNEALGCDDLGTLNQAPRLRIGVLGHAALPPGTAERLKASGRTVICVFVGLNLDTSMGYRIEFYDPQKEGLRNTTIHANSCRFADVLAYSWQRQGLRLLRSTTPSATTTAQLDDDIETIPTEDFVDEDVIETWKECDTCGKERRIDMDYYHDKLDDWEFIWPFICSDIGLECFTPPEPLADGEMDLNSDEEPEDVEIGVVDEILSYDPDEGKYRVKWVGGDETWEPARNLSDACAGQMARARRAARVHLGLGPDLPATKCSDSEIRCTDYRLLGEELKILFLSETDDLGDNAYYARLEFRSGGDLGQFVVALDGVREEARIPLFITQNVTPKQAISEFSYLDWGAAYDKEVRNLENFGTFDPRSWRTRAEVLKEFPGAHFSRIITVRAVKHAELGREEHIPKVRAVVNGCDVTDADGRKAEYERRYVLPASLSEVRIFFVVCLLHSWRVCSFDVEGAYLQADLSVDLFVWLDRTFEEALLKSRGQGDTGQLGGLYKLVKALYGHELSGFEWTEEFELVLGEMGFTRDMDVSTSIFVKRDVHGHIAGMVLTFADDGLVAGPIRFLRKFERNIKLKLKLREFKQQVGKFLGAVYDVQPPEESGGMGHVSISTSDYVRHLVERYREDPASLPPRRATAPGGLHSDSEDLELEGAVAGTCRSYVGSLMYGARCAWPAETQSVTRLARKVQKWTRREDKLLSKLMNYLWGVKDEELVLRVSEKDFDEGCLQLLILSDADFGDSTDDKRSTSGYILLLVGRHGTKACLDWNALVQKSTALSTGDAELTASVSAGRLGMVAAMLLEFLLGFKLSVRFLIDSKCAISVIKAGFSSKLRYMKTAQQVSVSWLHDHFREFVEYVCSRLNYADLGTKALSAERHRELRKGLGHGRARPQCKCYCAGSGVCFRRDGYNGIV